MRAPGPGDPRLQVWEPFTARVMFMAIMWANFFEAYGLPEDAPLPPPGHLTQLARN